MVEITDHVDISSWSERSRLIARRTKLTDGDQQSFADHDGYRLSVFLTNQPGQSIPQLDLDHRSHARVEDQIRQGKDCGLRNLPFREFAHNQVWVWLVMLAQDLIAWTKQLCLTETARAWELKRLRYRLLHQSARIARHARRTILRLSKDWARAGQLAAAHAKLQALPTLPSTLTHRGAAANPLKTNTGPAISVSLPTNNAAQNRRGRQHHDHADPAAHGTPNARPSRSAQPLTGTKNRHEAPHTSQPALTARATVSRRYCTIEASIQWKMIWRLWAKYFTLRSYVYEGRLASHRFARGE